MGKRQRQEEEAKRQTPKKGKQQQPSDSGSSGRSTDDRGGGRAVALPVQVVREDGSRGVSAPFVAYFANGPVPAFANDPPHARRVGEEPWRFQVYENTAGVPQQMLVSERVSGSLC
jgi:hypothetical protein